MSNPDVPEQLPFNEIGSKLSEADQAYTDAVKRAHDEHALTQTEVAASLQSLVGKRVKFEDQEGVVGKVDITLQQNQNKAADNFGNYESYVALEISEPNAMGSRIYLNSRELAKLQVIE